MPQLFADIRTNWTAQSIKAATGINVNKIVPRGLIDKRNSGAGALDYAMDLFSLDKSCKGDVYALAAKIRDGFRRSVRDDEC